MIILVNTQRVNINDAIAGNDACSFVWGISGGFNAIDLSYGPIGSIPWVGSGGGGEEGKQNMGGTVGLWRHSGVFLLLAHIIMLVKSIVTI